MIVEFKTRKLEKCYEIHKQAVKEFGDQIGRRYIQRINIIKATVDINELMELPALRCHPLTGDRKGQYAMNLNGFNRLIFTLKENLLTVVRIEEVSKHYDN